MRYATIRRRLGGTLNDVVLATVAGAVGRFLVSRGCSPDADTVFRTMVPVSVRDRAERGRPGNRVVNFLAQLPVHVEDPVERLARTREVMARLKSSRVVSGSEVLEEFADRTFTSILIEFVRLAANTRAYNLVVTNVPGPKVPLYLLGAQMSEIYPLVPLFVNQGLGIALFSYRRPALLGFLRRLGRAPRPPRLHARRGSGVREAARGRGEGARAGRAAGTRPRRRREPSGRP